MQIVDRATNLAVAENVIPLCEFAKGLEEAGEFEQAADTLRPFWTSLGERPNTTNLDPQAKAELLLRSGALTGWLGSAKQLAGSQDLAKDLISESATLFSQLGMTEKTAEAHVDLAICYWREGGLDEARITLKHVLETLGNQESEQRLRALLNIAIVEKVAARDLEALRICKEAAPLFDRSTNHALKGKFHNSYATLLKSLAASDNRTEYVDSALVEFTAAGFHFGEIGRYSEAHEHLARAHDLLMSLGDQGGVANSDDTRAQVFLMEGKYKEAEKIASSAVRTLTHGGEQTILVEALTTQAKALARLEQTELARTTLDQAIDIAQRAGDPHRGGIAALSALEELGTTLTSDVLLQYYRTAEALLTQSQNGRIKMRLGECARRILSTEFNATGESATTEASIMGSGFSLDAEVLRYEGNLIRQALQISDGSVTRAARLLGVTHQGLAFILNGRHSDLLSIRTPVKRRRKSIIRFH
jgi:tetratricopeptide (TPR) repeat protein